MCGNHSTLNKCDRCIEFVVETTKVKAAKKPKVVIAKEPEMPALEAIEEEVGEVKYPVDTVPEKPTPKPAPEEIIDLSSDSDEMADVPAPSCVKKAVASRDFVDLTMDD
jgi:folylpolyglutamate synthase/dihydropteroate synthase